MESIDWGVYAVEALFLILFLSTVWRYVRQRDRVTGALALIFSSLAVGFFAELWEQVTGSTSPVLTGLFGVLLIGQPVFTLYLVALVRPVPRLLVPASALLLFAATGTALVFPAVPEGSFGPRSVAALALIGLFVATEAGAAILLLQEAIRRRGPVAVRMGIAAISTAIFAMALLASAVAPMVSATPELTRATAVGLAFIAGLGYVLAFLTPGPLRRIWHAQTTVDYTEQLIGRSTESIATIWQGFTDAATQMQGGSAAMLTGPKAGLVAVAAATGLTVPDELQAMTWPELDARLNATSTRWDVPVADVGPIRRGLAEAAGAKFASVVPVDVPGSGERAALVLLSKHRTFFHPTDAQLLAALGAQTAIVAERRTVIAEQEDLAARLSATVEALRSASAAKSDFVASMSHEFRTPLSAIIGFSDLMATEPRDGESVKVPVEWVEHIQRGGQHLLSLVNDVLDLARVEAGRLDLQPETVDIAHAITEAVNGVRPLADRKSLALEADVIPAVLTLDRGRLRQILYNLISNAIKYTPEGGSVRVRASQAGGEFRIAVVDTGVGIAPEEHAAVFEEFKQVGDPNERQPGSGLGLAVTKRLAEAHGGRIELESARGQGSTFTLVLPVAAVEAPTQPEPEREAAAAGATNGDILIIEDDPSAVRLLREYLESAGYSIRVAPSGETGLAAATAERPAAIVLDVLLPGIDGWEVLRRLKADRRVQDVPVVIVTVVEERDVGFALGAVDYIVKPIHRQTLLACLSRYVNASGTRTTPKRVLVVDDEEASIAMIRGALEPEGVEIVAAHGGREALAWAERGELVDMVICDLVMPEVDGFEVIAALKENDRTAALPIVVCTGHDLTTEQKAKLNGHILGIVEKGQNARVGLLDWLRHAAPSAAH
jgi:signal transduction histidine kinase/CheY-like chemotaxis protein